MQDFSIWSTAYFGRQSQTDKYICVVCATTKVDVEPRQSFCGRLLEAQESRCSSEGEGLRH